MSNKQSVDAQDREYKVGDKVARAAKIFTTDGLFVEIVTVTKIKDGRIYLNNSKQPVRFPERMVILG